MKIVFVGDISLNGFYVKKEVLGKNPFNVDFSNCDYVVGNIECLAKGDGENLLKNPRLKTNVSTLNLLKSIGVNIALLAHNHVYDNLRKGFDDTIEFFVNNNIKYLGASTEVGLECEPIILKDKGTSDCLLNYVTKDTNPNLPIDADVYLNWFKEESVIEDIKKYKKKCNYVFLLLHWGGNMEGAMLPDFNQKEIAHKLIDAGADLIIGNHSHTIQPYEIYNGKYIFYSLGNFCFSDDFSDNGDCLISMDLIRYRYSRVLFVDFKDGDIKVDFCCSFRSEDDDVCLIRKNRKIVSLFQILFKIVFFKKFFWDVYRKFFVLLRPINSLFFDKNEKLIDFIKRVNINKIKKYIKS